LRMVGDTSVFKNIEVSRRHGTQSAKVSRRRETLWPVCTHFSCSFCSFRYPEDSVPPPDSNPATNPAPSSAEDLSQQALDLLAANRPVEAVQAFRAAIAADSKCFEAHHGLIRALRDAGQLEQAVAAALALTALTPGDPLAHTALSISLQAAGHVPEAEAAAARARILEWKIQLQSQPNESVTP